MSTSTWNENEARVDWRRVGAMSTAFNLHIVAGAALLLATAHVPPPLVAVEPPPMELIIVDPEPIPPPPPPIRVEPEPEIQPVQPVRTPQRPATIDAPALVRPVLGPSTPVAQPARPARIEATVPVPVTQLDRGVGYERVRQPQYPIEARRLGIEGETLLRVLVGSDGQVLEIGIARSSGDRHLDRAALSAVRSWRFQPAIESGRPVTAWVQVPITFRIGNH